MKWIKRGKIYSPPFDGSWKDNSALTPTPVLLNGNTIRVYAGFRDKEGVSRIGYVDVDADNPQRILKVSEKPVLDIGKPGTFDDNGLILGDIVSIGDKLYMYYVGFQLVKKVKFLAFTGLAISSDNGETFQRHSDVPVFDRSVEALYDRTIHSVMLEGNKLRVWYALGSGWEIINDKPYPQYEINYIESNSYVSFPEKGISCIKNNSKNMEYRIGRPRVYKFDAQYLMFFTYGTTDGRYTSGMATSSDGIHWDRNDETLGLSLSSEGWDSKHLCYPALISANSRTYVVYNGNNMGYDGFGYAELADDSI
jgi:predicted GH43/DUF377 family glycosyl hydrolase